MLKSIAKYLRKKQFMEPPLLHMDINYRFMFEVEWNIS